MKSAVIVFPGSNCDRDVFVALAKAGCKPVMVWHRETTLPRVDLIVLPGGFSYGDYLRCGAMAAHSPIMREVKARAGAGVAVLGICNGFQILTEAGLLPGVLMRNAGLRFICRPVALRVDNADTHFTRHYRAGQRVTFPIAHADGNYFAAPDVLARLEGEGQVAFRYCDAAGQVTADANPNGALANIAGVLDAKRRVLGLMPHPERAADPLHGATDGVAMFKALAESFA